MYYALFLNRRIAVLAKADSVRRGAIAADGTSAPDLELIEAASLDQDEFSEHEAAWITRQSTTISAMVNELQSRMK